jgi:hypothetical protein
VRDALDRLADVVIAVPVWDAVADQGDDTEYRVLGFARIQRLSLTQAELHLGDLWGELSDVYPLSNLWEHYN